jgi:ceramide glucosyltransferase
MTTPMLLAAAFCAIATALHLASIVVAGWRCRAGWRRVAVPAHAPPVSLIRPLCGFDPCVEETLRSAFRLDYPHYEIVLCVAQASDPIVPLAQQLIALHPQVPARLLIGDESISENPKLDNVCKGWRAARHEWIAMADSNVLMPPDYLQRLLAAWRDDTGLVSSPPAGARPDGFWAEVECAFLNAYQARWQLAVDAIGFGFAQGKSMLFRRSLLEKAGGMQALAAEPAEDAAATKIVRARGLRVRLIDAPFEQPLGRRAAAEVWKRQLRWARLRRVSFPQFYALEAGAGALLPLAALAFVVVALDLPPATLAAFAALWFGAEAWLSRAAGWPLSIASPLAFMLRDLMLPLLWACGLVGRGFEWRGRQLQMVEAGRTG